MQALISAVQISTDQWRMWRGVLLVEAQCLCLTAAFYALCCLTDALCLTVL